MQRLPILMSGLVQAARSWFPQKNALRNSTLSADFFYRNIKHQRVKSKSKSIAT